MKFCKDCIHHHEISPGIWLAMADVCDVENMIDPVDGKKFYRRCAIMRTEGRMCGPDGKLFQSINPNEGENEHRTVT